jgi:predicted lipoprotein with Yx(FWY)xxD motif
MTRMITLSALALAGALVLAACGSSSNSNTASTSTASTAKSPATTAALVTTKKGPLGTFLVDAKGRTLYLWEADKSPRAPAAARAPRPGLR